LSKRQLQGLIRQQSYNISTSQCQMSLRQVYKGLTEDHDFLKIYNVVRAACHLPNSHQNFNGSEPSWKFRIDEFETRNY